jgi:tetratricopeptide (TPR) repeat protein
MYRLLPFLLVCLLSGHLFAQTQDARVSKLKSAWRSAADDRTRVRLLGEISYAYLWTDSDSAIHYAQEQLSLALRGKNREQEIMANKNLANTLNLKGMTQSALQYLLQGLRIAEELGNDSLLNILYAGLGALYSDMGNKAESIPYLMRSLEMSAKLGDNVQSCHNLVNLGITYQESGQLDSALQYIQLAYSKALETDKWEYDMMGAILLYSGVIQYKLHNYDIALAYYRKALTSALQFADWVDVSEVEQNIADYYLKAGRRDSALHHYRLSMSAADRIDYNKAREVLSGKMAGIYKNGDKDSAFKYLNLQMTIKDSLFNEQQVRTQQNMIFRERLYQEEKQAELIQSIKERNFNLQLLAIIVFIIGFFSVILVLAKVRIRPAVVEWLGVIALLMLFEFIALLIHPFIEKWTDHSPVYMLLALMVVAAGMGPLHHKVRGKIMSRLTRSDQSGT